MPAGRQVTGLEIQECRRFGARRDAPVAARRVAAFAGPWAERSPAVAVYGGRGFLGAVCVHAPTGRRRVWYCRSVGVSSCVSVRHCKWTSIAAAIAQAAKSHSIILVRLPLQGVTRPGRRFASSGFIRLPIFVLSAGPRAQATVRTARPEASSRRPAPWTALGLARGTQQATDTQWRSTSQCPRSDASAEIGFGTPGTGGLRANAQHDLGLRIRRQPGISETVRQLSERPNIIRGHFVDR